MPKRKYTDAQRATMGLTSSKRKQGPFIYDDEIKPRKGANLEHREESGGGTLMLVYVLTIIAAAYFLR